MQNSVHGSFLNIFLRARKFLFVVIWTQIELDYTMKLELKPLD